MPRIFFNIWLFKTITNSLIAKTFAKAVSKFCSQLNKPTRNWRTLNFCCQSGEISPNQVTVIIYLFSDICFSTENCVVISLAIHTTPYFLPSLTETSRSTFVYYVASAHESFNIISCLVSSTFAYKIFVPVDDVFSLTDEMFTYLPIYLPTQVCYEQCDQIGLLLKGACKIFCKCTPKIQLLSRPIKNQVVLSKNYYGYFQVNR